jgi:hypothetical protein
LPAGDYLGQICPNDSTNCIVSPAEAIALGCNISDPSEAGFAAAIATAHAADFVVLMLGIDQSVEAESLDRPNITLPDVQLALLQAILAVGKPSALVLLNGGMLALGPDTAPAMIEAGYPGVFGGPAIAQTLFGDNEHLGGKLSYTIYPAGLFVFFCSIWFLSFFLSYCLL